MSEDTVRRDLRELAAQGLVQRVHGGALPRPPARLVHPPARDLHRRRRPPSPGPQSMSSRDARVIILDGSTTNLELARRLPADRSCTVLTNSPPIAAALAEHPAAEVVMIGGRLDKRAQVTVGAAAIDFLRSVRADACVLGVCALHPEAGLSTDDLEEAHVKRAMVEASADVVALATSDKLRAAQRLPGRAGHRAHPRGRRGGSAGRAARPVPRDRRDRDARMSRRWATTGVFFVNGAAIGTWVAQIPWIQERFDLSESAIGLVILGMSLAVVVALPIAGQAVVKHGSARMTVGRRRRHGAGGQPRGPRSAPRAGCRGPVRARRLQRHDGRLDEQPRRRGRARRRPADHVLAPRRLGVRRDGRRVVRGAAGRPRRGPARHGGARLRAHAGVRSSPAPAASARARPPRATARPRFTLPSRGVALLAALCLLVMLTEGAMADWGGLYLRQELGAERRRGGAGVRRSSPAG